MSLPHWLQIVHQQGTKDGASLPGRSKATITLEHIMAAIPLDIQRILDQHELWLSTQGHQGKKAKLAHVTLKDTIITGRNLSHVDFESSKFTDVTFEGCTLAFSYAPKSHWTRVSIVGTKLTAACFRETVLVACDFTGSDMYFATMTDALFKSCTFDKTLLKNANLTNSKLTNSPLDRAYLCDTILTGSTLRDAGTASVHHLTRGIIKR